ncbi:MAG: hypothetical protein D6798_15420 [Deltaproteobacteria bacterium]|nr:MAG: hypothetical protein D6798_15420 [Deltaproteobacteria bacterium]
MTILVPEPTVTVVAPTGQMPPLPAPAARSITMNPANTLTFRGLTLQTVHSVGALSTHFKATDHQGRIVDVQIPHIELQRRPGFREEWDRANDAWRRLAVDTPVAELLDDGNDRVLWRTAAWFDGWDLNQCCRRLRSRSGPPDRTREALTLAWELARLLDRLHTQGRCHGRLAPERILLGAAGDLCVTGLATPESCLDLAAVGTRTPERAAWTSPEVLGLQRPGPHTDAWSVGVVLFMFHTLRHPFLRRSVDETEQAVLSGLFSDQAGQLPTDVAVLVEGLLRPRPGDRPDGPLTPRIAELLDAHGGPLPAADRWPSVRAGFSGRPELGLRRIAEATASAQPLIESLSRMVHLDASLAAPPAPRPAALTAQDVHPNDDTSDPQEHSGPLRIVMPVDLPVATPAQASPAANPAANTDPAPAAKSDPAPVERRQRRASARPVAIAALVLLGLASVGWWASRSGNAEQGVAAVAVDAPGAAGDAPAVSPDEARTDAAEVPSTADGDVAPAPQGAVSSADPTTDLADGPDPAEGEAHDAPPAPTSDHKAKRTTRTHSTSSRSEGSASAGESRRRDRHAHTDADAGTTDDGTAKAADNTVARTADSAPRADSASVADGSAAADDASETDSGPAVDVTASDGPDGTADATASAATIAAAPVAAAPQPTSPPSAGTTHPPLASSLDDLTIDVSPNGVHIRGHVSGEPVRPLGFMIEGEGGDAHYVVRLKDTHAAVGFSRMPVASSVSSGVSVSERDGMTTISIACDAAALQPPSLSGNGSGFEVALLTR